MKLFLGITVSALSLLLCPSSLLAKPTSQPEPAREYSVKTKNFSHYTSREAKHTASKASPRAIVVLYQGSNPELMEQVLAGASDAKDGVDGHKPVYVRGMLIGPSDPNFKDGTDSYIIFVNGLPVSENDTPGSEIHDASINPRKSTKDLILEADDAILQPRLQQQPSSK